MINKKYFRHIAIVAAAAALLFQVQPAIAAEDTTAVETVGDVTAEDTITEDATTEDAAVAAEDTTENNDAQEEETQSQTDAESVQIDPIVIEPVEMDPIEIDIPGTEENAETETAEEETSKEEAKTTEAPAEEAVVTETPAAEETTAEEFPAETPEYKTDFAFENEEVRITATASQEAKLPQNTEMRAVKLQEGTAEYENAKAASAQTLGTDENAQYCFYDVTFVVDGQEITPEQGTVTIQMEFKNIQVDEAAQSQNIVHIKDTANGRQVQDVTSAAENGSNLKSVDFVM